MKAGVKVFAPASVANVACGYDVLGFALEAPGDEIIARPGSSPGLKIAKITGDANKLPLDIKSNTAGTAALTMLQHLGKADEPIELEIHKKMPFGSGLGSSAASAAGAVMAVNELLGRPLDKRELLPFAVLGEQVADGAYHADNVAPSLMGGMILIRDNTSLDFYRIPVPQGIKALVLYPEIEILTKEAREIIRSEVPLQRMIEQTGNIAGFITGMFTSNYDLISRSLRDVVIEPQRAQLIPHFYKIQEVALDAGALGCSISGAGPSIFALFNNTLHLQICAQKMQQILSKHDIRSQVFISDINQQGTVKF